MSKKSVVVEAIAVVGGKINKAGHYEMTQNQFYQLDAELGNQTADYAFCKNKIDDSLKAVYDGKKKNKYAIIKIVAEKKVAKKSQPKTKVTRTGKTMKIYGEKKEDGRRFKVILVNDKKGTHYEAWLAFDGKRKKVATNENDTEIIDYVKAC